MSHVIRLPDLTWAALATYVGISAESLTDQHARKVIDQLICRAVAPQIEIRDSSRLTADQLLRAYRAATDSEGWLRSQKKANLKRLALKLRVITKHTNNGRYYRNDELIQLIMAAPLGALIGE